MAEELNFSPPRLDAVAEDLFFYTHSDSGELGDDEFEGDLTEGKEDSDTPKEEVFTNGMANDAQTVENTNFEDQFAHWHTPPRWHVSVGPSSAIYTDAVSPFGEYIRIPTSPPYHGVYESAVPAAPAYTNDSFNPFNQVQASHALNQFDPFIEDAFHVSNCFPVKRGFNFNMINQNLLDTIPPFMPDFPLPPHGLVPGPGWIPPYEVEPVPRVAMSTIDPALLMSTVEEEDSSVTPKRKREDGQSVESPNKRIKIEDEEVYESYPTQRGEMIVLSEEFYKQEAY